MSGFTSNIENPRKIGKYVEAFEAGLHNDRAFLQEFEKVDEQLNQMAQANYNLKEQLKKAIEHNRELQDTVEKINRERKDATKEFTSREDDTTAILVANDKKLEENKVTITSLANVVKKLQTKLLADKKTEEIQADELATKDTELGAADADASDKDATWTAKLRRMQQEKLSAINEALGIKRLMTQQTEEIIRLREKITALEMEANATVKRKPDGLLNNVNIKY
jgi:Asp-tRNA(Asn)/Glu-tRNA(Gln) amidotransferase B subunit